MKKRVWLISLCVAVLLCGCLPGFADLPNVGGLISNGDTPVADPAATTERHAQQENMPQAYAEILDALVEAFPWNDDSEYVVEKYPEMSYLYRFYGALSDVGYALTDLDRNGQPELLLSSLLDDGITDAYSLVEGKAVHLFDGGERYRYCVRAGGLVENQWSGSAAMSGYDFSLISGGELILQERIVYDAFQAEAVGLVQDAWEADVADCWFCSRTVQPEDYLHISYQEAQKRLDAYHTQYPLVKIQYQPLSDYAKP